MSLTMASNCSVFKSLLRFRNGARHNNVVSEMCEQAREHAARVVVVLNQKQAQPARPFRCTPAINRGSFRTEIAFQGNGGGRSKAASATAHCNRAAMQLDEVFANGQAKTEAAEFSRRPALTLFERSEE